MRITHLSLFILCVWCECDVLIGGFYCPYYDGGITGYSTTLPNNSYLIITQTKPNFISYSTWFKSLCKNKQVLILPGNGFLEYQTTEHIDCAVYQFNVLPQHISNNCITIKNASNQWIELYSSSNIILIRIILIIYNVLLLLIASCFMLFVIVKRYGHYDEIDTDTIVVIVMIIVIRMLHTIYVAVDPTGAYHVIPINISRFFSSIITPWMIIITTIISNKYMKIIFSFPRKLGLEKTLNMINLITSISFSIICFINALMNLLWIVVPLWFTYILFIYGVILYITAGAYFIISGLCLIGVIKRDKNNIQIKIFIISVIQVLVLIAYIIVISAMNIKITLNISIIVEMLYGLLNLVQLSIFSGLLKNQK